MEEVWLPCPGAEHKFHISNYGRVKSFYRKTPVIHNPDISKNYYLKLKIGTKRLYIHRLVALLFIPNPDNFSMINHINGLRGDNRMANLEWCNNSHNVKHAYRIGLHKIDRRKSAKLNTDQILLIRKYIQAQHKTIAIAKAFGVSRRTISDIKWGHVWADIR